MSTTYLGISAELKRTPTGWLAVSKPGSILRIGVVGHTRQSALKRFAGSLAAWEELRKLPDPPAAHS